MLAVYEAAQAAVDECRAGQGPVLLELLTYRRTGHSRRDPCHYQPKEEREAWAASDPIERFADVLQRQRRCRRRRTWRRSRRASWSEFNEAVAQCAGTPRCPTVHEI